MNIYEFFKKYWIQDGLILGEGVDQNTIIDCLKKFDFIPPKDFISLYSMVNGIDDMDSNFFSLWDLDRILEEK